MSTWHCPTWATQACGSTATGRVPSTGIAMVPPCESTAAAPSPCSWVVNSPWPVTAPRTAPRMPPCEPRNTTVDCSDASCATSRSASTDSGPEPSTSMIVT